MKPKTLSKDAVTKILIHPAAKSAYDFYTQTSCIFFAKDKPPKIFAELNDYQILLITRKQEIAYVFSGFANQFFDITKIHSNTTLIQYADLSDEEIARIAWTDVLRTILSSKLDKDVCNILRNESDTIPDSIKQNIFGSSKITIANLVRYTNLSSSTINRYLHKHNRSINE